MILACHVIFQYQCDHVVLQVHEQQLTMVRCYPVKFCHLIKRPRNKKAMHHYGWEPLIINHHPAKIGAHWHCGCGDIFLLAE